ncbi:MAG: hypothetical protein WDN03_15435 [Rhizomicrobium sp.]
MAQYPAEIDLSTLDGSNGFAITGVPAGAYLGWSVASAGDINRDGYADLIIGAPRDGASSGTAYVLLGSAAGFAAAVDVTALNGTDGFAIRGIPGSGEATGESVSSAGDINGDGFADLIIGAPYAIDATLNANPGAAYVVFGHGGTFSDVDVSSLDGSNGFRILGAASGDRTGYSVSSVGDINGDGFGDVVVGAEDADPNGTASGAAYVVFGRAGGFGATVDVSTLDGSNGFKISGAAATDQFGHSVSSAGDVNGDGFADIVIGAFGSAANGTLYGGASYVVFGKATGFAANIDLSTLDGTNGFLIDASGAGAQHVGWSVAGAGDVNGDGFADLLISARNANGDAPVSGVSYVVFGKASGFGATVDLGALDGSNGFAITGAHSFDYASWSVKSAGDVNGDGFDDVIIGALDADPNGHDAAGAAYVVFGKPGGFGASVDLAALDGTDGFEIGGFVPNGYAGASVSAAGDLNGDGLSDLIVGAYHASSGGSTYAGQSYVVYGILPDGPVTRTGTDASQTLVGGHFDDTLNGLGGDDLLYSNGGNDTLNGGDGNDGFALKGTYTAADHIDGGDGSNDQIALDGDYSGRRHPDCGVDHQCRGDGPAAGLQLHGDDRRRLRRSRADLHLLVGDDGRRQQCRHRRQRRDRRPIQLFHGPGHRYGGRRCRQRPDLWRGRRRLPPRRRWIRHVRLSRPVRLDGTGLRPPR